MYYLGIDLGGTNISAGLCDENGGLIAKTSTPTMNGRADEDILNDMAMLCERLIEEQGIERDEVASVGIGMPGSIDREKGMLKYANNINFNDVNVVDEINKRLNLPVYIENDANCAAIGETACGASSGYKNVIYVTLGTGVGAGIIVDGKVYKGSYGGGGEAGHMVIVANGELCTCGRKGCWEAYASASALAREGRMAAAKYPNCKIYEMSEGNIKLITAKMVFDAAEAGDEVANEIIDRFIEYVAIGIVNLINIFQPEAVVLGGGLCAQGVRITEPIARIAASRVYGGECKTKICVASLGNDAGIVGAAILGRRE